MLVRSIADCPEFRGGDSTTIRELLSPLSGGFECRYSLAHASLEPGQTSTLHRLRTSEVYFILQGTGQMEIEQQRRDVARGDTIYIPPLASQRITNTGDGPLEFLCIVDPAWKSQDEEILE